MTALPWTQTLSDEGGDPACWLHFVCPHCGRMREDAAPTHCPNCGERVEEDRDDARLPGVA